MDGALFDAVEFFDWDLDMDLDIVDPDNPLEDPDYVPGRVPRKGSSDVVKGSPAIAVPALAREVETPRATFLDLPEHIIIRILEYAGLLQPKLIDVVFEKVVSRHRHVNHAPCLPFRECRDSGGWGSWPLRSDYLLPPRHVGSNIPSLPVGVFLASKAARELLGRLFFSRTDFSVFLRTRATYKLFCKSFGWGFRHLRHLYVDLGPREHRCLRIGTSTHWTIMKLWTDFCNNAADRMPRLVDFSFKCKVMDNEVAEDLISALDPFPIVARCAIWLHHQQWQRHDFYEMMKRTAWRLTDNRDKSFPFLRLPREVQLMVLEHLLTNRWDPWNRCVDPQSTQGVIRLIDRRRQRNSCRHLTCCGTCSPMRAMCFCSSCQNAYSTTCNCFTSPVNYFLVSRRFYEDCRRVFFSQNVFAFVEEGADTMMRTLHQISASSLLQMSHLIFDLPLFQSQRYPALTEHETLISWAILRRFIREHFDISRLIITIMDITTKEFYYPHSPHWLLVRSLLKSFRDMRGLRDFRVFLPSDRVFEKEVEEAVVGPAREGRSAVRILPFVGEVTLRSYSPSSTSD